MAFGKFKLQKMQEELESKKRIGSELMEEKTKRLKEIYSDFQNNLQYFASKYRDEINRNPNFRDKFNNLCSELGVDAIVSRKTIWTDLGFGDFYNELAMKILDICSKKRSLTGGLMKIADIIAINNRTNKQKITKNDIERALGTISCLGSGCCIFKGEYVCTVPFILSDDTGEMMNIAEEYGFVSFALMNKKKQWTAERYKEKSEFAIKEGLVWVDKKKTGEIHLFFPSMMTSFVNEKNKFLGYLK